MSIVKCVQAILYVHFGRHSAEQSPSPDVEQRRGCLEEDLAALLASGEAADVTLRVGRRGCRLAVHRVLLVARCPALAAVLRVKGVRPAVFAEVMRFVYTGKAALEADSPGATNGSVTVPGGAGSPYQQPSQMSPGSSSIKSEPVSPGSAGLHTPTPVVKREYAAAPAQGDLRQMISMYLPTDPSAGVPDHHQQQQQQHTKPEEDLNWRLLQAAKDGAVEELRVLTAVGADVETRDEYRKTALHWAAERGYARAVDCLLSNGAEVNTRDRWQLTPLHRAAERGHQDVVTVLLEAGADKSAMDNRGRTPLYIAKVINRWQIMNILR
ncbi:ankyrin repeat domain-containing protein 1-like [Schistocerca nitens]|uniref:ankyrin repeat domain-containing protein 1-like n=1 Tax=Schistocerca nitens TaxID=7011 RepID=UPI002119A726|nr:ankyrin repeat domain-containing protein 1-like [Schistocerca nitens]